MPQLSKSRKKGQFKIQKGRCYWCDHPLTLQHQPRWLNYPRFATWDHLTPKRRGGGNEPDNTRLCCVNCNLRKGDMTETQYRTYCDVHGYYTAGFEQNLKPVIKSRYKNHIVPYLGDTPIGYY